jgi:hypothetical protein
MRACVFINLPGADERRRGVEAAFAQAVIGDGAIERFEAVGPAQVDARTPTGSRRAETIDIARVSCTSFPSQTASQKGE